MSKAEEIWLQTDEAEDVAGSLRHAVRCLDWTQHDEQAWKWFAIAIHNALQGACVCHLVTTVTPVGVVDDKSAAAWLRFVQNRSTDSTAKPPRTFLLPFSELLNKIRQHNSIGSGGQCAGLEIADEEYEWLKRFHDQVRNQFIHFEPMSWSLEVSGLPQLAALISRIISSIANAGWAFRHKHPDWYKSLITDLATLGSLR